jgi:phage gp36-like protein
MAYASKSDLDIRFGTTEILQLADRDGSGVVDTGVVEAALADADVEIDGYLAVLYTLPLTPVPELVKRLSCDIARYRLWKDRASEQVRKGYEDSIDTLKRIAAGTVRIVIVSTGVEPDGKTTATPATRVSAFTDDTLALMP